MKPTAKRLPEFDIYIKWNGIAVSKQQLAFLTLPKATETVSTKSPTHACSSLDVRRLGRWPFDHDRTPMATHHHRTSIRRIRRLEKKRIGDESFRMPQSPPSNSGQPSKISTKSFPRESTALWLRMDSWRRWTFTLPFTPSFTICF